MSQQKWCTKSVLPQEFTVTSLRWVPCGAGSPAVPRWKNNRNRKHRTHPSTSPLQQCWSVVPTSAPDMAPPGRAARQHGTGLGVGWPQGGALQLPTLRCRKFAGPTGNEPGLHFASEWPAALLHKTLSAQSLWRPSTAHRGLSFQPSQKPHRGRSLLHPLGPHTSSPAAV